MTTGMYQDQLLRFVCEARPLPRVSLAPTEKKCGCVGCVFFTMYFWSCILGSDLSSEHWIALTVPRTSPGHLGSDTSDKKTWASGPTAPPLQGGTAIHSASIILASTLPSSPRSPRGSRPAHLPPRPYSRLLCPCLSPRCLLSSSLASPCLPPPFRAPREGQRELSKMQV